MRRNIHKEYKEIARNMSSVHVYVPAPLSFGESESLRPLERDNSTRRLVALQTPRQWYGSFSRELRLRTTFRVGPIVLLSAVMESPARSCS